MSDNLGDFTIGLDVSEFTNSMNKAEGSADDLNSTLDKTKSILEDLESQQGDTAAAFQQELSPQYDELQAKIEETKAHIEELQAQQEQFSDADIDSTEYEELSAEIESATAELESLQAQAEATGSQVDGLGGSADNVGASFESLGSSAEDSSKKMGDADSKSSSLGDAFSSLSSKAGALGGAIGGLVSGGISGLIDVASQAIETAIEFAKSFDEANSILIEKTGAAGDALDEFNQIAKDTSMVLDGMDVAATAGVVGELNTRLDITGDSLQKATYLIGQFADATGADAEGAVISISKVMKNWNVDTEEMGSLLDKMTVAGQKTGVSVDALSESLITNKAQLQQMGFSLDESIALISNFEKEGINSSKVMMGFNTAIAKWSDEGVDARKGFEQLSKSIKNATTDTEAIAEATDYFGRRAGTELVYAIRSGRLEFEDLTEAIQNSNGAMIDTADRADTWTEKMDTFGNAVGTVAFGGEPIPDLFGRITEQADLMDVSIGDAILQYLGLQEAQQGVVEKSPELEEALKREQEETRKQAELESLAAGGYDQMSTNMDSIKAKIEDLNEQYQDNYENAYNNISGSIGLFDEMTIKSGKSVNKMIGSLKSQVAYMDNYSSNMRRAAEMGIDEGLLAKLSDGSQESAEILQSIVDDGGEHIAELNEEFSKVEEGKQNFADTYAQMATDFDKNMGQIEARLGLAVGRMNQYEEAYDNGSDTVKGFIKGSQSHYNEIYNAYKKVAEQANRAVKNTLSIKSPSRVMMQLGEYTTEGFVQGALGELDSVQNAFTKISKIPMNMDISTPSVSNIGGSNTINVSVPIQVSRQMTDADITRKADMITNIVSKKFAEATGGSLS